MISHSLQFIITFYETKSQKNLYYFYCKIKKQTKVTNFKNNHFSTYDTSDFIKHFNRSVQASLFLSVKSHC